ncbi:hypothetical protein [Flavobacterium sp. '19STA2R22 D10 B1']|uniref:hypothetical protein n=1 Tax=Flavobacterium aerium TaxID=3037261 RepID=UPI00278C72DF|nr:hypothetical protein [Flavobacterium sp. '19STA2R22 D10 B1']
MSLNNSALIDAFIAVFTHEQTQETDPNASVERIAKGMAAAIELYVKSGTVNVNVETTGTANAQTGTGTGNIT